MTSCFLWFCFRWIKQLLASPSTCCRTHTSNPTPVKCSETTAPLLPQRQLLGMFKGSLTPLKCNVPGTSTSSVAQKLGLSFQKAKISLWDLFRMRSVPQLCPTLWLNGLQPPSPQAPLSVEFSREEHWSGLAFPTLGDLPDPGNEPAFLASPALSGGFFTTVPPGIAKVKKRKTNEIKWKLKKKSLWA